MMLALPQDLDEAMPAYYAAIKALDSLDKKAIQEMKSFSNPPQVRRNERDPVAGFLQHSYLVHDSSGCSILCGALDAHSYAANLFTADALLRH